MLKGGTLLIDGSDASSAVTVENGGVLGGTGFAGAVTVDAGGTFAPGDPSTITVADLTLESGSTFSEQIGGTAPGTGGAAGYDQTRLHAGAVEINDATLDVTLVDGFTPSVGGKFTIIDELLGQSLEGTFAGLANGAAFQVDDTWFRINYNTNLLNIGDNVTLTDLGPSPCYCPGTLVRTPRGERERRGPSHRR